MYIVERTTKTKQLSREIRKDLIAKLNARESWEAFARCYSKAFDYNDLLQKLQEEKSKKPAERLLLELDKHNMNVEFLCDVLEECKLYDALLILRKPDKLTITVHPSSENNECIESYIGPLTLNCKATAIPPPMYQWFHGDELMQSETTSKLCIDVQCESQEGPYRCRAYQVNDKGELLYEEYSNRVCLKLKETPIKILLQIPEYVEIKEKDTLLLQCRASSYPPPVYQWYKDDKPIDKETGHMLEIPKYSPSKEGRYHCRISNTNSETCTHKSLVTTYAPREKAVLKVALLIANENYEKHSKLTTVRQEVASLANILKELNFHVICLTDLTLDQMKNAIDKFCEFLIEGAYGFFYYCGHGIQLHQKYLMPVETPILYKQENMISEAYILSKLLKKTTKLLVVVLDMCLNTPSQCENPLIHAELPMSYINEGKWNLILAYSTSRQSTSREPENDHQSYTLNLCKYLRQGFTVNRVFELSVKSFETNCKSVQKKIQIPIWATSVTRSFRLSDEVSYDSIEARKCESLLKSLINIQRQFTMQSEATNTTISFEISCVAPFLNAIVVKMTDFDKQYKPAVFQLETFENLIQTIGDPYTTTFACPRPVAGSMVISLNDSSGNSKGACLLALEQRVPFLEELYKNRENIDESV